MGGTRGSKELLEYVKEWSVPSPTFGERRETLQKLERSSNFPSTRRSRTHLQDEAHVRSFSSVLFSPLFTSQLTSFCFSLTLCVCSIEFPFQQFYKLAQKKTPKHPVFFFLCSPAILSSQQLVSCVWGRLVVKDLATGTNIPSDISTNKVHLQACSL